MSSLVSARILRVTFAVFALVLSTTTPASAQESDGRIDGRVSDSTHTVVPGANVRVAGTTAATTTDARGEFSLSHVPAGQQLLIVRRIGFAADSARVEVAGGATVRADLVLRPTAQSLERVIISASPRLNETSEQALEKQRNADNIVTVLSGDVIRALPNANAAEAAARIPGRLDGAR